jgi:hypothetical protein
MATQIQAEKKEDKRILAAVGVITLLLFLCVFVFNTNLKEYSQRAGLFANLGGAALMIGSWVFLWFSAKNFSSSKGVIYWLVLLGLGIALSCGFNFGDHGTSQQDKIDNDGDKRQPAEDMIKKSVYLKGYKGVVTLNDVTWSKRDIDNDLLKIQKEQAKWNEEITKLKWRRRTSVLFLR